MIAGRLENLIEEIEDRPLERGHLSREPVEQHAVAWGWLLLQPVSEFAVEPLDELVKLCGDIADEVARLVVGLERCAPRLAAAWIGQIGEVLGEARDQVALGEYRIDRKIDLEAFMQFKQPRPDRVG